MKKENQFLIIQQRQPPKIVDILRSIRKHSLEIKEVKHVITFMIFKTSQFVTINNTHCKTITCFETFSTISKQ
ncbi:hypothetical protein DERF_009507 [Dermatophagoides farinae]|uniref:Uncharacterized protein n=1 Tax=Dermatophagoides farinae TaxID=6954 RepID=A0A922HU65_DERFA|nr:hypothetical protein DERF_009507 [Dermatophagoides farinae]